MFCCIKMHLFSWVGLIHSININLSNELEWDLAKVLCAHLDLFCMLTEIVSGSRYPTSNLCFPKICEIKLLMNSWKTSPNVGIMQMAKNMIAKFEKYWDVIHGVLAIWNILDPRFKRMMVHFFFLRFMEMKLSIKLKGYLTFLVK